MKTSISIALFICVIVFYFSKSAYQKDQLSNVIPISKTNSFETLETLIDLQNIFTAIKIRVKAYPASNGSENYWLKPWTRQLPLDMIAAENINVAQKLQTLQTKFTIIYKSDGANYKLVVIDDPKCREILRHNLDFDTSRPPYCSYGISSVNAKHWKHPKNYKDIKYH